MKKALVIVMMLMLVASATFAEITIGAWGRGIFLPIADTGADNSDPRVDTAPSWGDWNGDESRIGFTIAGKSDNVGFQIDMNVDGGNPNCGDQRKIWVKPFDMLTLSIGRIYDDTLRGNAAYGSFNWYRKYGDAVGEDVTFSRIGINAGGESVRKEFYKEEFEIALTPVENLYVAAIFENLDKELTEDLFRNAQYAAGYTIPNIGQIRAQYIGWVDSDTDDTAGRFEAAFKVTAVQNLYADIGFATSTNTDVTGDYTKIAAYGNYKVQAATIHATAIYEMLDDDDGMNFGVGLDYDLGNGLGLNADLRYFNDIYANKHQKGDGSDSAKITGMLGITKGFSNGLVGIGVQFANQENFGYCIPVRLEYWF